MGNDLDVTMLKCHVLLLCIIGGFLTVAEVVALINGVNGTMWTGYIGAMCLLAGVVTKETFDRLIKRVK